jgi:hypothetical protein
MYEVEPHCKHDSIKLIEINKPEYSSTKYKCPRCGTVFSDSEVLWLRRTNLGYDVPVDLVLVVAGDGCKYWLDSTVISNEKFAVQCRGNPKLQHLGVELKPLLEEN